MCLRASDVMSNLQLLKRIIYLTIYSLISNIKQNNSWQQYPLPKLTLLEQLLP
jgi:hypothetical protein